MRKIFVLNKDGSPLMPTDSKRARILFKKGKIRCVSREPMTVQMFEQVENPVLQDVTLGIDAGSKMIGSAALLIARCCIRQKQRFATMLLIR